MLRLFVVVIIFVPLVLSSSANVGQRVVEQSAKWTSVVTFAAETTDVSALQVLCRLCAT